MSSALLLRNRNYRLLFSAGALTNLGDGLMVVALPWLATLMTRDPVAIATVAAALRLPWMLFALPAGVIIDQADRRKMIARADLLRAAIIVAIMGLALGAPVPNAVWLLTGLAFLLGSAEVLRDNAAQTILPAIVAPADLEAANGQMWSAEQITGQFIGPPLAGLLIAAGIALPFGIDAAALVFAAGLVWLITLPPQISQKTRFWPALVTGVKWMRQDRPLLRLAIVLGLINFLDIMAITILVIFAQELLGLTAAGYGILLSIAAIGAVVGSLGAPMVTRRISPQTALILCFVGWGLTYAAMGLSSSPVVVATALFLSMATSMVWNVITVSWRQRRIPAELLGRVNSIYRFFGSGSLPLGALAGGLVVSLLQPEFGRELALRAPFLLAAAGCAILFVYAVFRLRLE